MPDDKPHEHVSDADPIDSVDQPGHPLGKDADGDGGVMEFEPHPPGTEQDQPPISPEPSSTDHAPGLTGTPSRPEDQGVGPDAPRVAHATRPDNVGKNWDGTEHDPAQDIRDAQREMVDGKPDQMDRDWVYLPQAISTEFAIQIDSARDMVLMGEVTVEGVEILVNRGYVRRVDIIDQWVQIVSDVKSVRFKYEPNG